MNESLVPCPHCGADIRSDASFCRHCGSSDADGWKDEWRDDDDFESDDDFDYEEFVADEFGTTSANTRTPAIWRLVAVVLLIIFVGSLLLLV